MEWKDFIAQHDGLQIIKEQYNLTDKSIIEACTKGIEDLISMKSLVIGLSEETKQEILSEIEKEEKQ